MRSRLTLWYGAVFVATLLIFGLVLHFTLQSLITRPAAGFLNATADLTTRRWQEAPETCPSAEDNRPPELPDDQRRLPRPPRRPLYVACVDPQGRVLAATAVSFGSAGRPPEIFLRPALVQTALRSGRATDIVDGGDDAGPIYRVAVAVPDPTAGGLLGVVLVGGSVATEMNALHLLRQLLLAIGAAAVLVATFGGLFLAGRALAPARLALARQQTFIADASHELRTPLTLIRANAEVLLRHRDRVHPDDAALIEDIVTETGHMDRLTTNLLTLARLDAGRITLERRPVELAEIARGVVRRLTPVARQKGITMHEDYAPGTQVVGDQQALEQAALIILENAVKYTPSGGTVTIRTLATGNHVDLVVRDTGIGIPAEHLPRVGERFYRVDTARSPDGGGAGLGLSIAFGIASAHGGVVRITNTPDQGTQVTLRLAALRADRQRRAHVSHTPLSS